MDEYNFLSKECEDWINMMLEDETFEEFLERFGLTPVEVMEILVDTGMIDEEELKEYMRLE